MQQSNLILNLVIFLGVSGGLGIFIWVTLVLYLKFKWLSLLEDIVDDGVRFYTLNIFLAGQGVLQYGTIFLSSLHAKRYGMLEKRSDIPKNIQRLFIFAFCWFMLSLSLLVAAIVLQQMYM